MNSTQTVPHLFRPVLKGCVVSVLTTAVALATMTISSQAWADEAVYVLPAGGVPSLPSVIVRTPAGGEPHLTPGSAQSLSLSDGSVATYSDLVVLPEGDLLLAGGSGRGGVLFDADGVQRQVYFPNTDLAPPSSMVVAGFSSPDTPEQLLMGDDPVGRILIYDVVDERYAWHYSLSRDGVRGQIGRAVALPDRRIAVTVQWPSLSLSALKIVPQQTATEPELAVFSEPIDDDSQVLDGLHPVRDLAADLSGRMLVTSRDQLAIVDESGQLLWDFQIGDDPAVGGQFQSARWLESGLIIAATRQPGQWTSPHINHRLHLIDPDPDADVPLLDSSANFEAAPLRLELRAGTAPTGTVDFFADAYDFEGGSPADLLLVDDRPSLVPREIHLDETTFFGFGLQNDTDGLITVRRADFLVAAGACDDLEIPDALHHPWWSDGSLTPIESGDNYEISQQVLEAASLDVGSWCGQLRLSARDGTRHFLGQPVDFEIVPPFGQDSPVSVDVLTDFDDAGLPDRSQDDQEFGANGCACSTAENPWPSPFFILFLFLAGWLKMKRDGVKRYVGH